MQIIITAKDFDLTPAIESWVQKKSKNISKIDPKINLITVTLSCIKNNGDQACTAAYDLDRPGKNIHVEHRTADLYEAISLAANATLEKLRQEKDKS